LLCYFLPNHAICQPLARPNYKTCHTPICHSYFELIGPTGHFHSDKCNAYVDYWGPDPYRPARLHASEELYFVLSGAAMFESDGDAATTLGLAEHRFHASHQWHTMSTTDNAILTRAIWRGPDLRGLSQLTTPTD
jgi:hypothetical protein